MLVLPYRLRVIWGDSSHFLWVLALCFSLLSRGTARAEEQNVVAAASAFEQGQQAELTGNNERAAELFELADRIAPTPEALRSATRARLAASQLAAAAGNAEELLRRYPNDASSRSLAEQVLVRARPELTRFTFQCTDPCTVVVDGLASSVSAAQTQIVYVTPGSHDVVLGFEGDLTHGLRLQGSAAESRVIKVARPARSSRKVGSLSKQQSSDELAAASGSSRGLKPVYFWVGASLTVVTGALALWSGLDLLKARDDFESSKQPTRSQFEDGESKDLRTSVLLGTTGALLAGTAAIAAFTDFRGSSERPSKTASVSVDGRGARLVLRASF
jgi:hypothetical protein